MNKYTYNSQLSKFRKKVLFVFLGFCFFLPLISFSAGLVPCGGPGEPPCQLCHLFVLFNNIVKFLVVTIVPALAILMIAIGGFLFFLYPENPQNIEKAKSIFKSVGIGLLLVFSAWLVVNLFFTIIGAAKLEGGWFKIDCPL